MRKYLAATAVVSCALLLAACSSDGDDTTTDTPTQATTTSPAAADDGPAVSDADDPQTTVSVLTSCGVFYGNGDNSVLVAVETATPLLDADPTSEENAPVIGGAAQRINSVRGLAEPEIKDVLTEIQTPFQQAVDGKDIDSDGLQEAMDSLHQACTDVGYAFTE